MSTVLGFSYFPTSMVRKGYFLNFFDETPILRSSYDMRSHGPEPEFNRSMFGRILLRLALCGLFLGVFVGVPVESVQAQSASEVGDVPVPVPKGLKKKLDRILKKSEGLAKKYSVAVAPIDSAGIWYSANGEEKMNLASNGKMLSTAAALRKFGASHRYETRVHGALSKKGVVEGDLYIVGGGDPKIMVGDLRTLVKSLKNLGVKKVKGGIVVDDTLFDDAFLPPAFEQKNTGSAYRASAGALGVNYNAVAVSFKPGKKIGDAPNIGVNPASGYVLVDNRATTRKGKSEALTVEVSKANTRTRAYVDGKIGVRSKGGAVRRRIDDPGIFAGYVFKSELNRAGITVGKTSVKRGVVPEGTGELTNFASAPLESLARDTNEHSNNMMAETIFKSVGGVNDGGATWEAAQQVVIKMLADAGIPEGTYQYLNGSGLYEADFLSAVQMTQFLSWAHGQEDWGQVWVSTLPVSGKTGTLRGRMKNKTVVGRVRAKTGTLNQVVTLSGYVKTSSKGTLAFSFLFNDVKKGKANLRAVRRIQDSLCEALAAL